MPRWVLRIYWRPPLRSTPVPGSALAFSTGVQHWRSSLRSNSFWGQISLEVYIRVTSSITPVWGALGYGKNKAPTPPFFLEGVAALLFAPHPRAALRENLSDRVVCRMFSEVGVCPSSPCLATSHPTSHFIQSVTKVLLFVRWGRYRRARIDRRP